MSYNDLYLSNSPLVTNVINDENPIIHILGAPYDSTSTYRPGSRSAPNSIRESFLNVELYFPELDVDVETIPIMDLGNLSDCSNVEDQIKIVNNAVSELFDKNLIPGVLGGEHTITLPINRALSENSVLIVFDAHLDLRDEYSGLKMSHATYLRRLLDFSDQRRIIHIGTRAATKDEWTLAKNTGIQLLTAEDILNGKHSKLISLLAGINDIHLSVDLDVLDPGYSPGVSNPEPGGISINDVFKLIMMLNGQRIKAFDIVELSPPYDNGVTSIVAAKLLALIIALCK